MPAKPLERSSSGALQLVGKGVVATATAVKNGFVRGPNGSILEASGGVVGVLGTGGAVGGGVAATKGVAKAVAGNLDDVAKWLKPLIEFPVEERNLALQGLHRLREEVASPLFTKLTPDQVHTMGLKHADLAGDLSLVVEERG